MSHWSTACVDWRERLLSGTSLVPNLPLFEDEAARAVRIFKRLRLPDVIGNPTMGEAFEEWVFDLVRAVFGAYDPETNRRMIQEFFLLIPKKNGKSTIAAAIMVVAIIVNRRPAAEFLLIAPTMEVAQIAFKQASGIIRLDPELVKLFLVQRHIRTITHRQTDATIQIKAADTDVITGSKSTGILVDETHVFATKPKAAEVFVEIRGALAARPDGFMIQITTQSKSPPAGVFRAELRTARDVRDGEIDLPLLPVLYELPPELAADGGWKHRRFWPLVNPNLGISVDEAFLERELLKAERAGDAQLALFASQHFNVEIGLALRTDAWAGARFWQAAADRSLTLEDLLDRCEVVVLGIDGGGLDDLLGVTVLGRERGTRRWLAWSRAWVHRSVLELRQEIAPRLQDFAQAGTLTIVDDDSDADVTAVADIVEQVERSGLLPAKGAIGVDQVGITDIVDELERRRFDVSPEAGRIVGIRQGWTLSNSIKTAERRIAAGDLVHDGSEMMAWVVGNLRVEPRGNAITITKQAAGTAKIDPFMALLDAVTLMAMNPESMGAAELFAL